MRTKANMKVSMAISVGLLLVAVCLFLYHILYIKEGFEKKELKASEDFAEFTGLVFFTKTSDCEACNDMTGTIKKLYTNFPNNIRVVDCTDPMKVSNTLTRYKVEPKDMPKILSFKGGVDTVYNMLTDYKNLEAHLLEIMSSKSPPTQTEKAVAALSK